MTKLLLFPGNAICERPLQRKKFQRTINDAMMSCVVLENMHTSPTEGFMVLILSSGNYQPGFETTLFITISSDPPWLSMSISWNFFIVSTAIHYCTSSINMSLTFGSTPVGLWAHACNMMTEFSGIFCQNRF